MGRGRGSPDSTSLGGEEVDGKGEGLTRQCITWSGRGSPGSTSLGEGVR